MTSPNASASSGGMTKSRALPPSTSSRVNPVARSQASLKKRIRPSRSSTQTRDCVVSVRTLANSSPRTKSVTWARSSIDVEEGDLEGLEGTLSHADRGRGQLGQALARLLARPQRVLIGSAVLGVANAILKPILTILTLPLIIVTFGLFYFVINIGMVALAAWITPDFSIHGFWSYAGAVVVVWAVNWIGGQVVGDVER